MENFFGFSRPSTLEVGGQYFLLDGRGKSRTQVPIPVRFADYDPCPAFVIVFTDRGQKRRCPRDELFAGTGVVPSQQPERIV